MIRRLLLLVFLSCTTASFARVWRVVGHLDGQLNTAGLPWTKAYNTTMTVNGLKNEVVLYSVRYSQPAVEQLENQFKAQGAAVMVKRTEEGASGVARWPDREARFLVLSPKAQPRHLVFIFYPEPSGQLRESRFPVPEYDRGELMNVVTDDDTHTFFATVKTFDSPTLVHDFYRNSLSALGWQTVMPPVVNHGEVKGVAIYQKKKKICYVQSAGRQAGSNLVTLLVKGGAL
ncbi:hypothetical protein SCARR_03572 [Pontiella sulfatireligans]|uniref:Uncharacterized protein n=2 Tax=Pontiella sulfatireligans TaxID=2750658 RepID=A0A6C2UMW9_9BACT|nr:hypothetical protein SCARR_03572 [Pontiella sulfatireligans]